MEDRMEIIADNEAEKLKLLKTRNDQSKEIGGPHSPPKRPIRCRVKTNFFPAVAKYRELTQKVETVRRQEAEISHLEESLHLQNEKVEEYNAVQKMEDHMKDIIANNEAEKLKLLKTSNNQTKAIGGPESPPKCSIGCLVKKDLCCSVAEVSELTQKVEDLELTVRRQEAEISHLEESLHLQNEKVEECNAVQKMEDHMKDIIANNEAEKLKLLNTSNDQSEEIGGPETDSVAPWPRSAS
uniref:uncharacterized protein LOC120821142 n=1 Tax=Gasterosteus aculeatus aculeatus TaxID=481459 RepID=UPI001A97D690|nr:uncharacterized protein LOC120821142 [Gasterosteus aculeatus aculeatus]